MKIVVCLVGKSGSGKDTLAKRLSELPGWNNIVSCTTRPKREYEVDGKDYYFITNEEFAQKVLNGDMLEATCFNNWHYGTMKSALQDGINVGVWNPEGYDCLRETVKFDKDVKLFAYYLQCDDKMRLLRQLNREEHPDVHEIVRRFGTDEEDFEWLEEDDIERLNNESWDDAWQNIEYISKTVKTYMGTYS
jgi:guanylate kinase